MADSVSDAVLIISNDIDDKILASIISDHRSIMEDKTDASDYSFGNDSQPENFEVLIEKDFIDSYYFSNQAEVPPINPTKTPKNKKATIGTQFLFLI